MASGDGGSSGAGCVAASGGWDEGDEAVLLAGSVAASVAAAGAGAAGVMEFGALALVPEGERAATGDGAESLESSPRTHVASV